MFKVYNERCSQCLFSKDKVVGDARRKDILKEVAQRGSFFVCHLATIHRETVCCRGFYDTDPAGTVQIAKRLQVVEFVPLPDAPKTGAREEKMQLPEGYAVPDGYEEIPDSEVNERVQKGDLIWDEDGWAFAGRAEIGLYCSHSRTARPKPQPTVKRMPRRVRR